MSFYEWKQNNSGGIFYVDESICNRVIIEADTYAEAEEKAFKLGIYYDGVAKGDDCGCCGDRWYYGRELNLEYYYDKEGGVREYAQAVANEYGWTKPDARIFYKDNTVDEIFSNKGRVK